jgi:hypothetical protein
MTRFDKTFTNSNKLQLLPERIAFNKQTISITTSLARRSQFFESPKKTGSVEKI